MTLYESVEEMTGDASGIYWDKGKENIFINKTDFEDYSFSTVLYNPSTGKVRTLSDEEIHGLYGSSYDFDPSHFYSDNNKFYYVTQEGKTCLNDKIDYNKFFQNTDEVLALEFDPEVLSPDGKRLVYEAGVYWGEGWGCYCVANLDGTSQELLLDSDIWDICPRWLADGSYVYVGKAPRPKDDPAYNEDWNTTQPCIKLVDAQKNATTICMGKTFVVKPFAQKKESVKQESLEGCDVAVLDNGKVTFYNSTEDKFVPFVVETDSVINGVFAYGDEFFYTVAIGDELYLKRMYMSDYYSTPSMLTDWDLQLGDCVSETYGRASELYWIQNLDRIGINHNFSWDYYNFADIRFYSFYDNVKLDGWAEGDEESDANDPTFMKYSEDLESFSTAEQNYYYTTGNRTACLSDKIDFRKFVSNPEYYEEPEFSLLSIDPTRKNVAYVALLEWGDLGHGPLCYASLDGKVQMAFEGTDAPDLIYGWLKNGSLLFVGEEPRPTDDPYYNAEWNNTKPCIKIVKPDGTIDLFSHSAEFVVSNME
jgi:hypothetical protein